MASSRQSSPSYQMMHDQGMQTPAGKDRPRPLHHHHESHITLGGLMVDETVHQGSFSFLVSLCFTINYVMGTGFLTIPAGFAAAGAILGVACLCFTALLSNIAKDYLIETMARAELLREFPDDGDERAVHEHDPKSPLTSNTNETMAFRESTVMHRKYEIPMLCEMFLGGGGKIAYMACLCVYMYGSLWAYASVFSYACATTFPIQHVRDSYAPYLLLFGLVVWPLSCLELHEQVGIQVSLSLCRGLMVVFIVCTVAKSYISGTQFPLHEGAVGITMANWSGLYKLLPIACYAFIYHHSLPGLSHPVKHKRQLGSIFFACFAICCVAYGAIGLVVAGYFGSNTPMSCNLAWSGYGTTWAGRLVSYYVLLFPAIDVASAFPLNAITLGNSIMTGVYGASVFKVEQNRFLTVCFRLVAAVPPVVGAYFARDLVTITDYTGTMGFVITFIIPALLQWFSRRQMKDTLGIDSARVWYSNELSRKAGVPFTLITGVAMFIYVLSSLIREGSQKAANGVR